MTKNITNDQIKKAYVKSGFSITKMVKILKIGRTTIYRMMKADPELSKLMDDSIEDIVDLAEIGMLEKVKEGYFPAQKFVLERKGRNRGWGDTIEVVHDDSWSRERAVALKILEKKHE